MKHEEITPGYYWWDNGAVEVLVKVYKEDNKLYMARFGREPIWLFPSCFAVKHFIRKASVS